MADSKENYQWDLRRNTTVNFTIIIIETLSVSLYNPLASQHT